MFKNIGLVELLIIAVLVLLLFGAKKLPEFARGLVAAQKEFKKSIKDEKGNSESKKK
jgi:sec-independent protein translocase protein TatA